jgi:hypothetical protein
MITVDTLLNVIETLTKSDHLIDKGVVFLNYIDLTDLNFRTSENNDCVIGVSRKKDHRGKYLVDIRVNRMYIETLYLNEEEYFTVSLAMTKLKNKLKQEAEHIFSEVPNKI